MCVLLLPATPCGNVNLRVLQLCWACTIPWHQLGVGLGILLPLQKLFQDWYWEGLLFKNFSKDKQLGSKLNIFGDWVTFREVQSLVPVYSMTEECMCSPGWVPWCVYLTISDLGIVGQNCRWRLVRKGDPANPPHQSQKLNVYRTFCDILPSDIPAAPSWLCII